MHCLIEVIVIGWCNVDFVSVLLLNFPIIRHAVHMTVDCDIGSSLLIREFQKFKLGKVNCIISKISRVKTYGFYNTRKAIVAL